MKRTEGTWVNNGYNVSEFAFDVATDDNKKLIARVPMHSGDESLANARLIAAAPELLEALEYTTKALKLLENRVKELQGLPLEVSPDDLPKTLVYSNTQLLAKARGES